MRTRPLALVAFACSLVLARAADPRGDHADAPPSTAQEQLGKFHVPPGFEVQLVADETQIGKPMNLNFDSAGRLWVTCSELYPWAAQLDANGQPIATWQQEWDQMSGSIGAQKPEPPKAAIDTVRVLSDFAENGRARKVETFADKLNIPIGIVPLPRGAAAIKAVHETPGAAPDPNPAEPKRAPIGEGHIAETPKGDSIIVYSIPTIWLMTDWDGDGCADTREPLYTGFGFRDTHGMASNFIYWIDGWIYGCHGFRNHSDVKDRNGNVTTFDSGNTYRFRPDGSKIEYFTHGQTNPFGLAFDPLGNLYSADSHSKPVYMLLRGGYYEGIGKQHDGLGFAPRITDDDHGSSAIAGIAYYADEKFPEEYRGNLFNGNPVTQRINRDKLEWHGSTPRAIRQPDFLTCDDPWFRPVQVKLGPDGALWIADFYNPIIGHYEVPLLDPRRDHKHGRIWRVVYVGEKKTPAAAADAATQKVIAPHDLTGLDTAGLIKKLADPNLEVRRLATNELVDRLGEKALDRLKATLDAEKDLANGGAPAFSTPPQILPKAHAIWAIERLGGFTEQQLLESFAGSDFPIVLIQGLRALGEREIRVPDEPKPAAQEKGESDSHFENRSAESEKAREAYFMKVEDLTRPRGLLLGSLSRSDDAFVKREAIAAYGRVPGAYAGAFLNLTDLLADVDRTDAELWQTLRMSLRDLHRREGSFDTHFIYASSKEQLDELVGIALALPGDEVADFLGLHLLRTNFAAPRAGDLLRHVIQNAAQEKLGQICDVVMKHADVSIPQRLDLAAGLVDGARKRGVKLPDSAVAWAQGAMLDALASSDDAMLRRAIDALRDDASPRKLEPLAKIVRDPKRDGSLRLAALEAAANLPESRELLTATMADEGHMILRKRAAELLVQGGAKFQSATGAGATETVLAAMKTAPWELTVAIAGALAKTDAGCKELLDAVDAGKVSPRVLVSSIVARPIASRTAPLRDRAAALTKDLPPEDARLDKVIAERVEAFRKATPNVANGSAVFQKNCAVCHRFRNAGGNVGPNLDGVIARGPHRLAEDILDPNRNIDPGFAQTVIETNDGQTLAGIGLHAEGELLVMTDVQGKAVSVPSANVKSKTALKLSLMPPAFEQVLAPQEFTDLMGFLLAPPPQN